MSKSMVRTSSDHVLYCPVCASCLPEDVLHCAECGVPRPTDGWSDLGITPYPYLGKVIADRYILMQFIGEGATGYVYRGQALQIRRNFAVKIVDTRRYRKKEFQEELLRRFRLEVEAMSRLRNPHVVNIYEAMQLQESVFALIMDFVDGRTLQGLLDRVGRIKIRRTLDIIRQVANGLYEAHTQGIIHRDLKPENIMVERLPASGFFARILDFGIVYMMDSVANTNGFRGTPLYASPEQCSGEGSIDHRSDIYSLGCVFFHCITGQPPFPGSESLQVMDAHVYEPPPTVSDVMGDKNEAPAELDELLRRMLSKDPNERPMDLSEIIYEIDRLSHLVRYDTPVADYPRAGRVTTSFARDRESMSSQLRTRPTARKTADEIVVDLNPLSVVRPVTEIFLPESVVSNRATVTATCLDNTGGHCAFADSQCQVYLVNMRNEGEITLFSGATSHQVSLNIVLEHRLLIGAGMDGNLSVWSFDEPLAPINRWRNQRIFAMDYESNRGRLYCGTEHGEVISVEVDTGVSELVTVMDSSVSSLQVSRKDNRALVGFWGGGLVSYDLVSKRRTELPGLATNPISIVISGDGYVGAVLDEDGGVRIISLARGEQFFEISANFADLRSIAFAADGQLVGVGLDATRIQLWDIRNQTAMRHLG
jgi:eukaryotic-like serine/threonine-protein kinase